MTRISVTETPEITVVVPCFNAAPFLDRTLHSLLSQKGAALEVIVVDDGSTDNSLEVLRPWSDRIGLETGPNRGASAARNRGLALARGEHVLFMDADDFHEGEVLSGMLATLRRQGADLAYARCVMSGDTFATIPLPSPDTTTARTLLLTQLRNDYAPPSAILWRRSVIQDLGGWREDLRRNEDGELIYRAAMAGARPCISEQGRVVYWTHKSPDRVTYKLTEASLMDGHRPLMELADKVRQARPVDDEVLRAISVASFAYEKLAARLGMRATLAEIRRQRAALGFERSLDRGLSRLLALALGLGAKERLYHFAGRVRNFLRRKLGRQGK